MKVLGIFDWHNCGAALVEDGELTAACEEERLTRRKVGFGMPWRSMDEVLRIRSVDPTDVDAIAICGIYDPTPLVRWKSETLNFERKINLRWWIQYRLWSVYYAARSIPPFRALEAAANRALIRRRLQRWKGYAGQPIEHIDHHLCHARLGLETSGYETALVFTIDGSGDGASTALFVADAEGSLELRAAAKEKASFGKLYANATLGLGFSKLTGEGKVMGLAASGNPEIYREQMAHVLRIENLDRLEIRNGVDLLGNGWALKVRKDNIRFTKEDIAAATQEQFESLIETIVRHFCVALDEHRVVLVGGAAMNVKMNPRVRELPEVEQCFVPPAMTDAGVAAGAALELCHRLRPEVKRKRTPLRDSFLGPSYTEEEIREAISRQGLTAKSTRVEDIDRRVGELVADGFVVARFSGRMEHGPRSLGNRSILALPNLPDIEELLNQRLGRDEFMPFAPSILEEEASEYLEDYVYSPFMVETFSVRDAYREKLPAVTHVDGTLRPQIVRRSVAPGYWKTIQTVGQLTGLYAVLNTSFNLHGEPIVCSPRDALRSFALGAADYLALENWLVEGPTPQENDHEVA